MRRSLLSLWDLAVLPIEYTKRSYGTVLAGRDTISWALLWQRTQLCLRNQRLFIRQQHIFCDAPQQAVASCLQQYRRNSSFRPTSLYPRQYFTTNEDVVFWAIIIGNILSAVVAQSDNPSYKAFVMEHMRCSVDALYHERYYTLASCVFTHSSTIHCALNLLLLYNFRRFQPLGARELSGLYLLGGVAGAASHVTYHWLDAGGPKYGAEFAANTPAYMGCSGAVSAILAYKAFQAPAAMQLLFVLPLPVLLTELMYVALEVKEPAYLDGWPAKSGGAAAGVLLGLLAALTGRRVPSWLAKR